MCIPVHSPWLPGYVDVVQIILITLTMVGLFPDRPRLWMVVSTSSSARPSLINEIFPDLNNCWSSVNLFCDIEVKDLTKRINWTIRNQVCLEEPDLKVRGHTENWKWPYAEKGLINTSVKNLHCKNYQVSFISNWNFHYSPTVYHIPFSI